MKKYKYHFSFKYWNEAIPVAVSRIQGYIKLITATGFIATWSTSSLKNAVIVAMIGFAVDVLGHFIYATEITEKK